MSGLHINELKSQHLDYIGKVRPAVNLLMNPKGEQVRETKGRSPESKLIGRPYIKDGDLHAMYLQAGTAEGARQAGKNVAQLCLDHRISEVDAWLVLNEPPVKTLEQIHLLAEFDAEFARQMSRGGSKACIGAFSRGTPEIPKEGGAAFLDAYAPALRVAHEVGAWLAIHQYGKYPLLHESEYLALRWQTHTFPYYRSKGVPIPRYVVTEYGVDLGTGIDAQNKDGWRGTPYAANPAEYGNQLLQLAREYAKDPACLGATVFCAGQMGWQSFSVDGPLLDYMATLPWPKFGSAVAPAPTPQPAPIPAPTPAPSPSAAVRLPEWVRVAQAQGTAGQVWRLVRAEYQDETQSQHLHHIFIMEPHAPGEKVIVVNAHDGKSWEIPLDKPANEPATNFPMFGVGNSYSVQMAGRPSDVVSGLTMPGNRHVNYRLWFQLVTIPAPQPAPQPEVPVAKTLVQVLQAKLGARFKDVRGNMPKGAGSFSYADSRKMGYIILHHSTGLAGPVTPDSIAEYHVRPVAQGGRGWAGIGYHFVIDEGNVYYVGDVNTQRAHVLGRNDEALGICWAGTYDASLPSAPNIEAGQLLVQGLDEFYGHKKTLQGHGQFLPGHTSCPGRIVELIPRLRQAVAPVPVPAPTPAPIDDLAKLAKTAQAISPNWTAAIAKAALKAGYTAPLGNEVTLKEWICQLWAGAGKPEAVFYVKSGDWGNVKFKTI